MWIRKKEFEALQRRVKALEEKKVSTWEFGNVTLEELLYKLPGYIRKEIHRQMNKKTPPAARPEAREKEVSPARADTQ